jgi:acetylglutamate kinase
MISSDKHLHRAETLIEALPFMQKFRGQTFVIKYGGSAMEDDQAVDRLLKDVVFLEAVGINPVLVHGGGKAITKRLRDEGIKSVFVNGMRVTDADSIAVVEEILDQTVNPHIVETINSFGGKARGFSGRTVFKAKKLQPQPDGKNHPPVDVGFVGDVTDVDVSEVEAAVNKEIVPVVSPLGVGADGVLLNVNADIAAGALASALKASKMIYLSDVLGIMRDKNEPDSLIPSVNRSMIQKLIDDEIIADGMIPKVESALDALEQGVGKVHFIDGRIPHSLLLEIFTTAGVGTEILP